MKKKNNMGVVKAKILPSVALIVYGFIAVLTPNWGTFDSNGPKFLTIAILNLIVFTTIFFISKKRKDEKYLFGFFNTNVGFAYGLLMLLSLLSFVKAINVNESILHFAKIFTTFSSAWLISLIIYYDKYSIKPLAIAMSLLLVFDSIQTFQGISKYIGGEFEHIEQIKASYSNKNILTSAIFVKLPFAIWLLFLFNSWRLRILAILSLFVGFLAVYFMASRAFYLALISTSILLGIYSLVRYKQSQSITSFRKYGLYLVIVLVALGIFSFVQKNYYPQKQKTMYNFGNRLNTIGDMTVESNNFRLTAWGESLSLIKQEPFLGVGLGNWKLRVLEYENQYKGGYKYMNKVHNDFLEITTESGIVAGLTFIAIFLFVFWYFISSLFLKKDDERIYWFFLPALGLFAYSFDAFFNFPQNRPEIQSLFSIYIGIAVGLSLLYKESSLFKNLNFSMKDTLLRLFKLLIVLLFLGVIYILGLNVQSLKLQRIINEELESGVLKSNSDKFIESFPWIPDITAISEPIAVQKARYLLSEGKFDKGRELMLKDNSNPLDARKEYFIAMSYYQQNELDSALVYSEKARELKPFFVPNLDILASIYEKEGELEKALEVRRVSLRKAKRSPKHWIVLSALLENTGRVEEAYKTIDSASFIFYRNKKIANRKVELREKMLDTISKAIYNTAIRYYDAKDYANAEKKFSEFIQKVPDFSKAYELRAVSYFYLGNFHKVIEDIEKEEGLGVRLPANMINIKGVAYFNIGSKEDAKKCFKKAMNMGDKDATNNYKKLFGK